MPLGLPIRKGLFVGWSRRKEPFGLGWLRAGGVPAAAWSSVGAGLGMCTGSGRGGFVGRSSQTISRAAEVNREEGL